MQPPTSCALFPYTTLFRSLFAERLQLARIDLDAAMLHFEQNTHERQLDVLVELLLRLRQLLAERQAQAQRDVGLLGGKRSRDRKSTRLNSSHMSISYAVFC